MSQVRNSSARSHSWWLLSSLLTLAPAALACSSDGRTTPPEGGSGGAAPLAGSGGVSAPAPSSAGGSGGIATPPAATASGGTAPAPGASGGAPATTTTGAAPAAQGGTAAGGMGGAPAAGSAGAALAGAGAGGAMASRDHCLYGYSPDPSDDTMKEGPAEFYPAGKNDPALVDLTVQPEVIDYMQRNYWQAAHIEWHAIRTCSLPGGSRGSKIDICDFVEMIPKDQNCQTTGDGYQFMLFHRHMLESLKQLWPKHQEQFTGFAKFPQSAEDVPEQWRSAWKPFNATSLANAKIAEEIDKAENLAKFPDEGALGFWFQCNMGTQIQGFNMKSGGLHGDLHGHWIRSGNTEHGVGNTNANIDNYMFWKLHGWMDNVWEKYRLAKGQQRTDPKYVADMQATCYEMDFEAKASKERNPQKPTGPSTDPLPVESGFFHEKVRPIFESATNKCSGCHSETGAEAQMPLGGHISSKDIVRELVNQHAIGGGQYARIVPGKPDESWLYLKITAATSTCTPTAEGQCFTGPMPPSADGKTTVTAEEAAIVRQWILDGAKGPE